MDGGPLVDVEGLVARALDAPAQPLVDQGGSGGKSVWSSEEAACWSNGTHFELECQAAIVGSDAPTRAYAALLNASADRHLVLLHGYGDMRAAASFAKVASSFAARGFAVLLVEMPGFGAAGQERRLSSRTGHDAALLAAALQLLRAREAQVIAEGGGCGAVLAALELHPELFGANHVLLNPVLTTPDKEALRLQLGRLGCELQLVFADGFGADDAPFSIGNCGVAFHVAATASSHCEMVTLVPPRGPSSINTPGVKPMHPPEYLCGVKAHLGGAALFVFTPSQAWLDDTTALLGRPRREAVREDVPHAPEQSALAQGKETSAGHVKVFVRVRPMIAREADQPSCLVVSDVEGFARTGPPPSRIAVLHGEPSAGTGAAHGRSARAEFVFDRVFASPPLSDSAAAEAEAQAMHEQVVRPLVQAVVRDGINATLLAYGQTGSGKTFTMEGPEGRGGGGLSHVAVQGLFAGLPEGHEVHMQYAQLYNHSFLDLLCPPQEVGGGAAITVAEGKRLMYLKGATMQRVETAEQALELARRGAAFRATGATNMNDASSRSHAILTLFLGPAGAAPETGRALYMVDLAGSERVKRSGAVGARFDEATAINGALSALGRVVLSLVENDGRPAAHVPYKESPLTLLLSAGLGGRSKTALMACVTGAADSAAETLNTLRFAVQASHVKNKVAASDARKAASAAADKIEAGAATVDFDANNEAQVTLDDKVLATPLAVRGFRWDDPDLPVVVCLPDSSNSLGSADPAQFDGVAAALDGVARVLAPALGMDKDRDQSHLVPVLEALLDHFGVSKALLYGRDAGALLAMQFKLARPRRAGPLVLENRRDCVDEAGFKRRAKQGNSDIAHLFGGPWSRVMDTSSQGGPTASEVLEGAKKLKVHLLWPMQNRGRPSKSGILASVHKLIEKQVKIVKLHDSLKMDDTQLAAVIKACLAKPQKASKSK